MRKFVGSTLGILLLNPVACSGEPHEGSGSGGSVMGTGGYTGVVHCTPATASVCGPGKICKQTMFPIMPPVGVDSGVSDVSFLYECVPAGTGGSSGTGGAKATGGSVNTAGSKSTTTKTAKHAPQLAPSPDEDGWWETAEAAIRTT